MSVLAVSLLTMMTAAVPADTATSPQEIELLPIEANVIANTNSRRARLGLKPLQVDGRLMHAARRHASWMASRRSLRHTSSAVAENIAMGQSSSHEAVNDWMESPGHRANILSSSHGRIGVGAYRGSDGQIYWCQQFLW
jgi:uncharacterized protein YkwD